MAASIHEIIGREDDIERLWELLELRSVLLTGPRRVGKTELLRELVRDPKGGWRVVRADLEGGGSVEVAVDRIVEELDARGLGDSVLARAGERLESIELAGVGVGVRGAKPRDGWARLKAALLQAIAKLDEEERLVVALDEVPWWLDALEREGPPHAARGALAELRRLRQDERLRARVRFIFTGSVGLAGLAHDLGASAELNDITPPTELRPLSPAAGRTVFDLAVSDREYKTTDAASARAHEISGGLPHWLKELAQRITPAVGDEVSLADVDRAVQDLLQPRLRSLFQDEATEHLVRRYGEHDHPLVIAMLDAAAAPGGAPTEALITAVLALRPDIGRRGAESLLYRLVDAYYLEQRGDGSWRFLVPLFRLWWERYGGTS